MAKLVILSQGMTGRSHELKVDKTTIGRVEDNTFPIAEASVSSHHCEVLLRGNDVIIHDLNSTNGTFINGEKITESVLKPGQTLRLGQVELRLEAEGAPASSAPPPASKPGSPPAPGKKAESTIVMQQGVKLTELETGTQRGFGTAGKGFSKKDNKANKIFLIAAIVVGVIIVALVLVALMKAGGSSGQ
ncbi:MAG TPA: FHA domain-containing protein [Verrucomicrobiae bacterium]|nr:FHA domain-containing protein [Verrucomicrobiae bacterium]